MARFLDTSTLCCLSPVFPVSVNLVRSDLISHATGCGDLFIWGDAKQYGEGPERKAWFPMVILLDVLEEGAGDKGEDVTSRYEVGPQSTRTGEYLIYLYLCIEHFFTSI